MIENAFSAAELAALSRRKARSTVSKTIPLDQLDAAIAEGWTQSGRKRKRGVRVSKPKPLPDLLEDRVWTTLYRMGFERMSGVGGARLQIDPKDPNTPTSQIDIFAMDEEVAIAVECKSFIEEKKDPRFQERLGKHVALRDSLIKAVTSQFGSDVKRKIVLAMFTANLQLTENDKKRAEVLGVALFDESDLDYYESLTRHLGPAARFQFLCDLIPGKPVKGLEATLPALKTRMGGADCYLFSAHPEYLLKICYVSHRAKGKASDIDAYQRMVSKGRLTKIRQYISEDGIFPTNIVLSFQRPGELQFQKGKQEAELSGTQFGWLSISPTYKSAWIIDGQHRLFAYSGHPKANQSVLPILAFAGLPSGQQAELFIDINAEQRRVKKNLLQELFAELHWSSSDPRDRIAAVISKAIQQVDECPDSALYGRVLRADETRNPKQCISLTAVLKALDKPGFYVAKTSKGTIVEYGPLWSEDNEVALRRTRQLLDSWLDEVRKAVPDWWDAGADKTRGGLAMNDGVTICIGGLRSVLQYLRGRGQQTGGETDDSLVRAVVPYAKALGAYLAAMNAEGRRTFRLLRGAQGQQRGLHTCLAGMKQQIPDFNPPGLQEFLAREGAQTTARARTLIDHVETTLQKVVLQELREEFKDDWWFKGVPEQVRKTVSEKLEEDQGKRGGKEFYFDLIHYRIIASKNWDTFAELLGRGKGSKEKQTEWISQVNEVRKKAMHPSSGTGVSFDELRSLGEIDQWLTKQASGSREEGS